MRISFQNFNCKPYTISIGLYIFPKRENRHNKKMLVLFIHYGNKGKQIAII